MDVFVSLLFNALISAAVYVLLAVGLSFIYATTRVFHLAHGGVIAFAAYVFWWGFTQVEWSLPGAALVALGAAVMLGLLMNELVYEPLRRRGTKGLGYLVATLALLMMSNALIILLFGTRTRSAHLPTGFVEVLGVSVSFLQMAIIATAGVLLGGVWVLSKKTRFGKAMRATADNEEVAEVLGIPTRHIRRLSFALGSLLGGVAGIFLALEFNLTPNMGVLLSIKAFTATVVGGAGSIAGVVAGSLLLSGSEQAATWFLGGGWRNATAFLLLFLFLLVKPSGFFGTRRFH